MTENPIVPFPASPYCRVRARVASIWADGPDDGTHPDWRPADGEKVTLTPSIGSQLLVYDAAAPNPIIVTVERVECVVDEDGWLAKSDGRPVFIAPTDDPLMSATGWTWTATIKGKSIAFSAPTGGTVDLALFIATPAVDAVEYVSVVQIVATAVADYLTANPPDGGEIQVGGAKPSSGWWLNTGAPIVNPDPDPDPADTTAPTGAVLAVTGAGSAGSTRTLTVTGATDAGVGLHGQPYAFSMNGGSSWSSWQSANAWTSGVLTAGTYQPRVRVRDANSNADTFSHADIDISGAGSPLREEILALAPYSYYPLDDAVATSAANIRNLGSSGRKLVTTNRVTVGAASLGDGDTSFAAGADGGEVTTAWLPGQTAYTVMALVDLQPGSSGVLDGTWPILQVKINTTTNALSLVGVGANAPITQPAQVLGKHLVVATHDGTTGRLFWDGIQVATATSTTTTPTANVSIKWVVGRVSSFAIWYSALTPVQIENLATAAHGG